MADAQLIKIYGDQDTVSVVLFFRRPTLSMLDDVYVIDLQVDENVREFRIKSRKFIDPSTPNRHWIVESQNIFSFFVSG